MTNPEFIGPRGVQDLSAMEFARAELATIITAPLWIGSVLAGSADTITDDTVRTRCKASRNAFFKAIDQPLPDPFEYGITELTCNAISQQPELIDAVIADVAAAIGSKTINMSVVKDLETTAARLKSDEPARMHRLRQASAKSRIMERMRRSGLAAEPIHDNGFDPLGATDRNNYDLAMLHLQYEGEIS